MLYVFFIASKLGHHMPININLNIKQVFQIQYL